MTTECYKGSCNAMTPHGCDRYGSLLVVDVGPGWPYRVIVPNDGDTIIALGGERILRVHDPGRRTRRGLRAVSP